MMSCLVAGHGHHHLQVTNSRKFKQNSVGFYSSSLSLCLHDAIVMASRVQGGDVPAPSERAGEAGGKAASGEGGRNDGEWAA